VYIVDTGIFSEHEVWRLINSLEPQGIEQFVLTTRHRNLVVVVVWELTLLRTLSYVPSHQKFEDVTFEAKNDRTRTRTAMAPMLLVQLAALLLELQSLRH
jgi:accessory gene regulator protein AgrB